MILNEGLSLASQLNMDCEYTVWSRWLYVHVSAGNVSVLFSFLKYIDSLVEIGAWFFSKIFHINTPFKILPKC